MRVAHRTRIVGGVLFILVVALAGCTSASKPEAGPSLTGPGDLPIPPGFRQIEGESILIAFGGFQAGMVVYEGDREPSWVAQFYRGGLPAQGWTLVASFISKETILVFTKERQACVITVTGTRSATRLEVRVGITEPAPRSR